MADSISERFRQVVALHLVANFRRGAATHAPLMLGIQGPPGEGKTYQAEQVLVQAGVESVLVSGGELENPNAGLPAARIREAYRMAGELVHAGRPAAVLLNDADAALGSWGPMTQYTVNTQNVVTELMHLADYPCTVEGAATPRVPIILTGNDFTRIYAPLRRSGRMRLFTWQMTPKERAVAVWAIFPRFQSGEINLLIKNFPDEPISFWADVKAQTDEQIMARTVAKYGLKHVVAAFVRGSGVNIPDDAFALDDVLEFGRSVKANAAGRFL